jgi:hypothetical protein
MEIYEMTECEVYCPSCEEYVFASLGVSENIGNCKKCSTKIDIIDGKTEVRRVLFRLREEEK